MENLSRRKVAIKIHSKEPDLLNLSLCCPEKMALDKDNDPFQASSGPNRLLEKEASRKSQCRERFAVRGILWRTVEQTGDPCCLRVERERSES